MIRVLPFTIQKLFMLRWRTVEVPELGRRSAVLDSGRKYLRLSCVSPGERRHQSPLPSSELVRDPLACPPFPYLVASAFPDVPILSFIELHLPGDCHDYLLAIAGLGR